MSHSSNCYEKNMKQNKGTEYNRRGLTGKLCSRRHNHLGNCVPGGGNSKHNGNKSMFVLFEEQHRVVKSTRL